MKDSSYSNVIVNIWVSYTQQNAAAVGLIIEPSAGNFEDTHLLPRPIL
jgi:hypothetical protein